MPSRLVMPPLAAPGPRRAGKHLADGCGQQQDVGLNYVTANPARRGHR
jgi:hypothetical protein